MREKSSPGQSLSIQEKPGTRGTLRACSGEEAEAPKEEHSKGERFERNRGSKRKGRDGAFAPEGGDHGQGLWPAIVNNLLREKKAIEQNE